jgi:hypothetical protein
MKFRGSAKMVLPFLRECEIFSISPKDEAIVVSRSSAEEALLLARMAFRNGITGFVRSPEEASTLRSALHAAEER